MAKKNFYVVKVGRQPGIYSSWLECKGQVDGYKGAVYKGFATQAEAHSFLFGGGGGGSVAAAASSSSSRAMKPEQPQSAMYAPRMAPAAESYAPPAPRPAQRQPPAAPFFAAPPVPPAAAAAASPYHAASSPAAAAAMGYGYSASSFPPSPSSYAPNRSHRSAFSSTRSHPYQRPVGHALSPYQLQQQQLAYMHSSAAGAGASGEVAVKQEMSPPPLEPASAALSFALPFAANPASSAAAAPAPAPAPVAAAAGAAAVAPAPASLPLLSLPRLDGLLYCDGAAKANPRGPSGCGGVLYRSTGAGTAHLDESGPQIASYSRYLGVRTNNEAEYEAMIDGMELALKHGITHLVVRADSQLVVRHMSGEYKVRAPHLKPLYERALKLAARFVEIQVQHVMREDNQEADEMANQAIAEAAAAGKL